MDRIKELEGLLLYHKKKYYDGEPEISDQAYDKLEEELRELDPDNPVLDVVGKKEPGDVSHNPPMLSCRKAQDVSEVLSWADNKPLTMGYKVDGLSLKLVYKKGKLNVAATRGNGRSGEDVTFNVMKIDSIPKTISEKEKDEEVRGELYMAISEFERINESLEEEEKYSNPRNLAVGTLKQKDPRLLEERKLCFYAWDLIHEDLTGIEKIDMLNNWGFETSDFDLIETPTESNLREKLEEIKNKRSSLDFEIDGLVFKYNNPKDRKEAGVTSHHPKWQIALKFTSQGEITTIKDIIWHVGRTSVLTPVAELEPVNISGAMIRRVTLHNAEFLQELGANIGDEVYVVRSGDVIPKVEEVVNKYSQNNAPIPARCPSCGSEVAKEKGEVNAYCTGEVCPARDKAQIEYFVKTIKIDGLGSRNIDKLYEKGLIEDFTDLYTLKKDQLVDLLGKNGQKIYDNIEEKRELPFHLFLAGLGVESLGKVMGRTLAKHYSSIEELQNTTVEQLCKIEGISEITAEKILRGINNNKKIDAFLKKGGKILYPTKTSSKKRIKKKKKTLDDFLGIKKEETEIEEIVQSNKGLSLYVTGKVEGKTKSEVEEFCVNQGFEWKKSISSNLDLLVYGENPGKTKLDKARKIGVKILSWDEFIEEYFKQ